MVGGFFSKTNCVNGSMLIQSREKKKKTERLNVRWKFQERSFLDSLTRKNNRKVNSRETTVEIAPEKTRNVACSIYFYQRLKVTVVSRNFERKESITEACLLFKLMMLISDEENLTEILNVLIILKIFLVTKNHYWQEKFHFWS